jgi:hypothetical protein
LEASLGTPLIQIRVLLLKTLKQQVPAATTEIIKELAPQTIRVDYRQGWAGVPLLSLTGLRHARGAFKSVAGFAKQVAFSKL